MAGKNQPPNKSRVIFSYPRAQANKLRRLRAQQREATTRRVMVPRR